MQFEQPLIEGTLVSRERFKALVKLRNGDEITAHCANRGSLAGCADPGSRVLLSPLEDPRRKFKHQLEIVYVGRTPVGIHTGRPTSLVAEALMQGQISEVAGYAKLRRESRNGRDSCIDFVLEGNGLRPCFVLVENVTMASDTVAYFPDSLYGRGMDHLAEMTNIVREGNRAMIVFIAARSDVEVLRPADHIDPDYGQAFRDTLARGVEAVCYRSKITRRGIELDLRLAIQVL